MKIARFDMGTKYIGSVGVGVPDITGKIDGKYALYSDCLAIVSTLQQQIARLENTTINQTITIAELTAEKEGLEQIVGSQAEQISDLRSGRPAKHATVKADTPPGAYRAGVTSALMVIENNALAATCQSVGQYRSMVAKEIRDAPCYQ